MNFAITTGRSRTETAWRCCATNWEQLTAKLGKPKRTAETLAEYTKMSHADKGRIKDVGGFVGGRFVAERRKASELVARSLVTLDIDYGSPSTVGMVADAMEGNAWCLYSTHSHTAARPRFRLVVPLSREVTPDEYVPIARRLADDIGIDFFDDSTFEPCRLMYWPSCGSDADFVFRKGEGEPYDADAALGTYKDWRDANEWPLSFRVSAAPGGAGKAKMQDPTAKPGIVGAFCREYDIPGAIAAFLADVYEPTARSDRYTYSKGSTAQGLVVYDGGLYAYSNHGTDPAFGRELNAFDLVRVHKFGDLDAEAKPDTPINKMPSFVAMEQTALKDKKVRARLAKEKRDELCDDFSGIVEGGAPDGDEDWISHLQLDPRGKKFCASPYNFGLIVANDPQLKDTCRRDLFRGRDVVVKTLPWRALDTGKYWENSDDNGLIDYVSRYYRLNSKTALLDAHDYVVSRNGFHPVREYLDGLQWDGVPRLDTLLIDYLGAEDNALTRAVTRKHLCAAVGRVLQPGIKYDYILTLIGSEGLGKSTLIRLLGGEWFDDSLSTIEGKEGMEQLRGKWLIEIGEMTAYKKSTAEAYKAFLSKTEDSYRPAYGRKVEVYPRQCVFFATTNEQAFLKGDTGNRRFWTVEVGADLPTKDVFTQLEGERDQIWAEALGAFRKGEKLYLDAEMTRAARQRQEEHNEVSGDERAGMIQDYIRRKLPLTWDSLTPLQRQAWFRQGAPIGDDEPGKYRETISAIEVLTECMGEKTDAMTRYRTREINQILRQMEGLSEKGREYITGYGRQRVFAVEHLRDNKGGQIE